AAEILGARWKAELVADEHRRSRCRGSGEKEIETRAVGGRNARGALTASRQVGIVELPLEDDAVMLIRQLCAWQCGGGCRGSRQRFESRCAGSRGGEHRRQKRVPKSGRRRHVRRPARG